MRGVSHFNTQREFLSQWPQARQGSAHPQTKVPAVQQPSSHNFLARPLRLMSRAWHWPVKKPSKVHSSFLELTPEQLKLAGLDPTDAAPSLRNLAQQCSDPRAWLALQQDKHLLLDAQQNFIMYARTPEYQIGLRGPLGRPAMRPEHRDALLQEFLQRAAASHKHAVFYQSDEATLAAVNRLSTKPFYAYKLGEEAIIDLSHFSLAGAAFAGLRQNIRKAERLGLHFEFCPSADAAQIAQCAAVSEQWLARRGASEKRFSLGRFHAPALLGLPLALIYADRELVAFANVLQSRDRSLLAVDLMRHIDSTPRGTMDLLFARLLAWGQTSGYQEFSFGMAPLKDVGADSVAHSGSWLKIAAVVAAKAERFYNFRGVREYKEKWQPSWRPRYFLVPARRHALPALIACAVEIAGGLRAVVRRR